MLLLFLISDNSNRYAILYMIKKNIKNDELSSSLKNNLKLRKKQIVDRDKKKIIGKRTKKIGVSGLDLNVK